MLIFTLVLCFTRGKRPIHLKSGCKLRSWPQEGFPVTVMVGHALTEAGHDQQAGAILKRAHKLAPGSTQATYNYMNHCAVRRTLSRQRSRVRAPSSPPYIPKSLGVFGK
jgi:hypothetical protein